MKFFSSFVILLAVLFLSMNFSEIKADTGTPPIVIIYDEAFNDIDQLVVSEGESFILFGVAFGDTPFGYYWNVSGILIATDWVLNYSFPDPGEYIIELQVIDHNNLSGYDYVTVTVLPVVAPPGDICGYVTQTGGSPLAGVPVTLLDVSSIPLGDPVLTDASGNYSFTNLDAGIYSVSIMIPLGFVASPGETQTDIEPNTPCTQVNFELTPTVVTNDCKGMGYWKHQFSVYLTGHGNAQETEADLYMYLDEAFNHFGVLCLFEGMGDFGFEEAHAILSVKGNRPMESKARQHLFTLLLNFASGRIGNATLISEDNRDAADAITYVAQLILDGDATNDGLAKDICEEINEGQMLEAGLIPESNIVYKLSPGGKLPFNFNLTQNYPNPFNPSTKISFEIPKNGDVSLKVFDLVGREVATLINQSISKGSYEVEFNAAGLPSGIYFYQLRAEKYVETKKMVLMK